GRVGPLQGVPAVIPEVPLAKRRDQRGVAKISMFAYQRATGLPVWQSGLALRASSSNDVWLFGAGPFQHGTIYDPPTAVSRKKDLANKAADIAQANASQVDLSQEAIFASPAQLVQQARRLPPPTDVKPATHDQLQSATTNPPTTTPPSTTSPTPKTTPTTVGNGQTAIASNNSATDPPATGSQSASASASSPPASSGKSIIPILTGK